MFEYSIATQTLKVRMEIANNVLRQLRIQLASSTEALRSSLERASWLYNESSPPEDGNEVKGGGGGKIRDPLAIFLSSSRRHKVGSLSRAPIPV